MKKWIALLLALVLALGLMACASSDSSQDTASSDTTGDTATGGEEAASGEVTKIALLLPYTGDQSYFDVTARGLDLLEEKYGSVSGYLRAIGLTEGELIALRRKLLPTDHTEGGPALG